MLNNPGAYKNGESEKLKEILDLKIIIKLLVFVYFIASLDLQIKSLQN